MEVESELPPGAVGFSRYNLVATSFLVLSRRSLLPQLGLRGEGLVTGELQEGNSGGGGGGIAGRGGRLSDSELPSDFREETDQDAPIAHFVAHIR